MTDPTRDDLTRTWLVRLRWAAVAGQVATVAVADLGLGLELPYGPIAGIVVATAGSNLVLTRGRPAPWMLHAVVVGDTLLLTLLLALSGGPSNPFSALYLVHVALAAVALGPRWTWVTALLSAAAYGSLFVVSDPHLLHRMDATTMRAHLVGMWGALTLTGASIAVFVARLAARIADREAQLGEERRRAERAVRLASLGTLAGGAAHELGSPLGAIAVAADEAEVAARAAGQAGIAEDLAFIREQVGRCREILADLASGVGQAPGEAPTRVVVEELVDGARALIGPGAERVVTAGDTATGVMVPRRAAVRVLASLLRNGLAAAPEGRVTVMVTGGDRTVIEVRDDGAGMPADVLARAGEPFFTTRPAGEGMGLGLFLARGFAESVGGTLALTSAPGEGTTVTLTLPEKRR